MYSNNIVNFQESTTILNACTKKFGNLLNVPRIFFVHSFGVNGIIPFSVNAGVEENKRKKDWQEQFNDR